MQADAPRGGPVRHPAHCAAPPPESPAGRRAPASRGTTHETHCRWPQVGPLLILTHDFIPKTQQLDRPDQRVSGSIRDVSKACGRAPGRIAARHKLMIIPHHPVRKYRLPPVRRAHTIGATSRCNAPGAPPAANGSRTTDEGDTHYGPAQRAGFAPHHRYLPRAATRRASSPKNNPGDSAQRPPCIQMPAPIRPARPPRPLRSPPSTARCRLAICG